VVQETRSRAKKARGRTIHGNGSVDEAALRQLLAALRGASAGDFDLRLPEGQGGLSGELAKAFNDLAERRSSLADATRRPPSSSPSTVARRAVSGWPSCCSGKRRFQYARPRTRTSWRRARSTWRRPTTTR